MNELLSVLLIASLLISCFLGLIDGHSREDPILTIARSQHAGISGEWSELSLDIVPKFMINKQIIYHALVPKFNPNISTDFRIDLNFDLKVSFIFDHYQKLASPWLVVFDSIGRRSLRKVDVYFTHDEFEILKVEFKTKYGSKLTRIDPTHPTLRGFEMEYHWQSVQEEDLSLGIQVIFASAVLGYFVLLGMLLSSRKVFSSPSVTIPSESSAAPPGNISSSPSASSFRPPSNNSTPTGSGKYRKSYKS